MAINYRNATRLSLAVMIALFSGSSILQAAGSASSANDRLVLVGEEDETSPAYSRLWREKLLVTQGEVARFVSLPGPFGQETAVSVYRAAGKQGSLAGGYWVTVTRASQTLWEYFGRPAAIPRPADLRTIKIERADAPLPESTALAMRKLWLTMLKRAWPEPKTSGFSIDSNKEFFSAVDSRGKTIVARLPQRFTKNSRAIVRVVLSLMIYSELPASGRPSQARIIERNAHRLLLQFTQ